MIDMDQPTVNSTAATAVFFVGIGGMGMAPLALYLQQSGRRVSGYDDAPDSITCVLLRRNGIEVQQEAAPAAGNWLVVYSSAVRADHPTLAAARARGLRMIRRGAFLAEIARAKKLLAVVGSHGKTTTTGMLIDCLRSCGYDFGYILGGLFAAEDCLPAHYSTAPWLVAEIDESDGTIDAFSPWATLIVNLGWDHPDRYPTYAALLAAFRGLIGRTEDCLLIAEQDLTRYRDELAVAAGPQVLSYGTGGDYRLRPHRQEAGWTVELGGRFEQRTVRLPVEGVFNVHNAAAALTACARLTDTVPTRPLAGFGGIRRRQDVLLRTQQRTVVADYAHHPEEIEALLTMCRDHYHGELVAVFQPHRFSRTRHYADAFARVLQLADRVYLLPVYAACEEYAADGTSEMIVRSSQRKGRFFELIEERELPSRLSNDLSDTDRQVVVFIGAGNVDRIASQWVEEINRH